MAATLTQRAENYPPYSQEASTIALVWAMMNPSKPLMPTDVAKLMLVMKLVRYNAGNSPDSLTDLVGYAARLNALDTTND